jgi:dipeptidyl aminopeptidase/acylaminoacyl peptidase
LVASGDVDPTRVVTRGSSAGGLTALLASVDPLVTGAIVVGAVTDPRELAAGDQGFESGYVEALIGASDVSDDRYRDRSPRELVTALTGQYLVIHGSLDPIVPVEHTRDFVAALKNVARSVTYLELSGEGHTVSGADALLSSFDAEVRWYGSLGRSA